MPKGKFAGFPWGESLLWSLYQWIRSLEPRVPASGPCAVCRPCPSPSGLGPRPGHADASPWARLRLLECDSDW